MGKSFSDIKEVKVIILKVWKNKRLLDKQNKNIYLLIIIQLWKAWNFDRFIQDFICVFVDFAINNLHSRTWQTNISKTWAKAQSWKHRNFIFFSLQLYCRGNLNPILSLVRYAIIFHDVSSRIPTVINWCQMAWNQW